MKFSKAHFIGIAGKGMSATALLLREMGVQITGSDEGCYPPVSDYLKNEQIPFADTGFVRAVAVVSEAQLLSMVLSLQDRQGSSHRNQHYRRGRVFD